MDIEKEAIKIGREAEASKQYVQRVLNELKENYVYEITNEENSTEELLGYRGKLQALEDIKKQLIFEIDRGKTIAERRKKLDLT